MARLTERTRVTQAVLGEARIVLIGPAPRLTGRFAYMDDAGTSFGQTHLAMFSRRTWDAVNALKTSMEQDLADVLAPQGDPAESEKPEVEPSNAFEEGTGFSFDEDENA